MKGRQGYILRYYLPTEPYFDEAYTKLRFEGLVSFCKKTGVDAVMFYVALNPDFYYMPDSPELARKWRDTMLLYIEKLRKAGIGYQLNFQNLVGSTLGGVDFRTKYAWEYLVDHTGRENLGCACPIGKKFREDAGERLKIWAETKPDVIWIDDDLRYHNHGNPLFAALEGKPWSLDYYCFCDEHIRLYNERYATSFDRKTLVEEMTKEGEPSKVRRQYLDLLRDTMSETAAWIRATVDEVSPTTRVAQMTSLPDVHAAEGRDWKEFLSSLSGKYAPMVRSHFGPYKEGNPQDFATCYRMLEQTRVQIEESYQGEVEYCPEVENTRFTVWAKSAAATSFQLALSAFAGNTDITLSLFDLDGGALTDDLRYGKTLKNQKPFLDKLVALSLKNATPLGVTLVTSGESGRRYRYEKGEDYSYMGGVKRSVETFLLKMGIPCRYCAIKDLNDGGMVALDGFTAKILTDDEIASLLKGVLLLDGAAAKNLSERGFCAQLGLSGFFLQNRVVNAEKIKAFSRADGTYIRIPSRVPAGKWYAVQPRKETEILSEFLTPDGEVLPALTAYRNAFGGTVICYPAFDDFGDGFYTHYRVKLFKDVLARFCPSLPRIDCESYTLCAVREKEGERYYCVTNLSTDITEGFTLDGVKVKERLATYQTAVYKKSGGKLSKMGKTKR